MKGSRVGFVAQADFARAIEIANDTQCALLELRSGAAHGARKLAHRVRYVWPSVGRAIQ